jgi:hypothetical protein
MKASFSWAGGGIMANELLVEGTRRMNVSCSERATTWTAASARNAMRRCLIEIAIGPPNFICRD